MADLKEEKKSILKVFNRQNCFLTDVTEKASWTGHAANKEEVFGSLKERQPRKFSKMKISHCSVLYLFSLATAEFPSRSNSDAKALYEVREILRNDLSKYHGTIKPGEKIIFWKN
jgi:hypothetical protein